VNIMGASFAPSITVTPRAIPEVSRKPAKADLRVPTPDLRREIGQAIEHARREAGLTLDEIRTMLTPEGGPDVDRQLLLAKAEEIDAQIKRLRAMSSGLKHAAACPAPSHAECPSFQKLLKAAASGALEKRWGKTGRLGARS